MASDDTERPLLSGLLNRASRRRYRRCKSAPLSAAAAAVPSSEAADSQLGYKIQRWDAVFGKVHPSFKTVAIYLSSYLGIGTLLFYLVRSQIEGRKTNGVLDAVYFCVVTMTTVGYGDLVPDTVLTKLLACGFVFAGMALVCLILSKAADYLVEKQEILLVKALHLHQQLGPGDILKDIANHGATYKCVTTIVILAVLVVSGVVFLSVVEGRDLVDAFYCVCSTITTLGYGDQSFSTVTGRVFAVFWITASTVCSAQFFLYVAELNTEKRQRALAKWVLTRRMTNVDLEAADLDEDGVVGAAEFVIYKLKEMGKISQEDITLVLKEFEELDVDQSGTLSVSDLALAQSSPTETDP